MCFSAKVSIIMIVEQLRYASFSIGLAEKVHKTNLDATGREKW
jgi:hypothetical protein